MNKCSECKFWNRLITFPKHGLCNKIQETENGQQRPIACIVTNEKTTVTNVFVSREDFGCSLHELILRDGKK